MRWKSRPERPEPYVGQIRQRMGFAFLPRKCEDGYTRWLQWLFVVEEFTRVRRDHIFGYDYPKRWVAFKVVAP